MAILFLSLDTLGSDSMETISDVSAKSEDAQNQEVEDKSNGWDTFGFDNVNYAVALILMNIVKINVRALHIFIARKC